MPLLMQRRKCHMLFWVGCVCVVMNAVCFMYSRSLYSQSRLYIYAFRASLSGLTQEYMTLMQLHLSFCRLETMPAATHLCVVVWYNGTRIFANRRFLRDEHNQRLTRSRAEHALGNIPIFRDGVSPGYLPEPNLSVLGAYQALCDAIEKNKKNDVWMLIETPEGINVPLHKGTEQPMLTLFINAAATYIAIASALPDGAACLPTRFISTGLDG